MSDSTKIIINDNEIEISFPLLDDKPTVTRQTVRCIIKHWNNNQYLIIKEKKFDGIMTLLGGGIEQNQSIEEAVKVEIEEESGFINIQSIAITPYKIHNRFYNKKKVQNQYSVISLAIVELASDKQVERVQEEVDLIDLKWVNSEDLLNSVDTDMDKFFIKRYQENEKF